LTVSMMATIVFSIIFFNFECNLPFICALIVVLASIYLYNREKIMIRFNLDDKKLVF
jgi:hypothetical protein